jgi:hypothetical protein
MGALAMNREHPTSHAARKPGSREPVTVQIEILPDPPEADLLRMIEQSLATRNRQLGNLGEPVIEF